MSWFTRIGDSAESVHLVVDGRPVEARPGDSVATALLAAGYRSFARNPATGGLNAAHCLIGNCFGCLCTIAGRPHSQACLAPVAEGMVVETIEIPETPMAADDE